MKKEASVTLMKNHFLEIKKLSDHLNEIHANRDSVNARDLYQIVVINKGQVEIKIGDVAYSIKNNSMYFLAPGQVSKITAITKGTDGYCIAFDTDYFLLCLKNQVHLCFYPFFQFDKQPILRLTKPQVDKFRALIKKIDFEYNNRANLNDDLLTKLYLNILLIEIERLYDLNASSSNGELSRKKLITSRFKQLVEKNFMTVRRVSDYAESLFISPNYLNDTVREITGHSASTFIHDRIILEAKALLVQTELTINQIAHQLQYNDTSYFCRFFRARTGVSPQVFREGNHF